MMLLSTLHIHPTPPLSFTFMLPQDFDSQHVVYLIPSMLYTITDFQHVEYEYRTRDYTQSANTS